MDMQILSFAITQRKRKERTSPDDQASRTAVIYRAIAETQEADALFPRLLGRLKSLLPGNGAGREDTGEIL